MQSTQQRARALWRTIVNIKSVTHGLLYGIWHVNCQTRISKRLQSVQNAAARIVFQANDVNITQSTYWRISIGYLCVTLLTTRSQPRVTKLSQPPYLTLFTLASELRVLRSSRLYVRPIVLLTQSSSTNIAARRFSCCAPTVWNSLPSFHLHALQTVTLVLGLNSRLMAYVRASDILFMQVFRSL